MNSTQRYKSRENQTWLLWGLLGSCFIIHHSEAAGKKPTDMGSCVPSNGPALSTPIPVRKVVLQPIGTKSFQLPNGSLINLSADLQSILNTAVTSYPAFSPTDPGQADPCNAHLEIRSAVTNFEMNVATVGVSFGYSPSDSSPTFASPSVTGKANVQIWTISMDFSVWNCVAGRCSAVAASTSTHLSAGVNLGLDIDFGLVKTGPSFIYNTPIGDIIRSIMKEGIKKLSSSARVNELPWQARVRDYTPAVGTLIFDAGMDDRIGKNQSFEIYAPTDEGDTGICHVYEAVAYVHTLAVDTVSSTAIVDQTFGSRGIKPGDVVMIRRTESK